MKSEAREAGTHFQYDDGNGQRGADPKPAAHISEFRVRPALAGCLDRLKRHTADWTRARTGPPSFRTTRLSACDRLALDTFPGQTRICFGSSPSRNDGNGRHSRCDAAISPDRPSFRRPDRSRSNLLPAASQRLEPHTPQGYIRCM